MQSILVTDGNFTYVAIDDQAHPLVIPQGGETVTA
jgi:acyl-CoA thioesterase YciA